MHDAPSEAPSAKRSKTEASSRRVPGEPGLWQVRVHRPVAEFLYELRVSEDNTVSGSGQLLGDAHVSQVNGQLQGYVLTWTEAGMGKFRATMSADMQSFTGVAQLDGTHRIAFEGHRSVEGSSEELVTVIYHDDSVRCPRSVLKALPALEPAARGAAQVDVEELLRSCPLEPAAHASLLPLLRALAHQQAFTVQSAVHCLGLADWLGCSAMEALTGAPRDEEVLDKGLLIRTAQGIEALAKDASRDRWRSLCGPAVLRCLSTLAKQDPDALRLSPCAWAALSLGLPVKEVHAALPSRLRFGDGGNSLVLDLRKRGIGPEGAARLQFPSVLQELDLDLTRCGIRAVGAASLRFPPLRRLRLLLQKCDIGPEGAKALALPQSLERLDLDLGHCLIGPAGAAQLQLPRSLRELDLSLLRCGIGDRGAKALVLPDTLQVLRLDLARCELTAEGARGLRIPPRLTSLHMDLTLCAAVGIDAIKAILAALPKSLEVLEMNLTGCKVPAGAVASLEKAAKQRLTRCESRFL